MVAEIKKVLEKVNEISLFDLALILKKTPEILKLPLQQLERKHYLEKKKSSCNTSCSGCTGCDKNKTIFYRKCKKK